MTSPIRVLDYKPDANMEIFADACELREHARSYPKGPAKCKGKISYLKPNYMTRYNNAKCLSIGFKGEKGESIVVEISSEMLELITKFMTK